ncbi:MAG: fructosamine kinase family protein [Flavobacteriales bacterium]|nr:fructosamine kinase family protein [Flavobacteriales bacterium]
MFLPGTLIERVCEDLSRHLGQFVDVELAAPVGGGSINDAWRLETDAGRFFLKTNHTDRFPSLFAAEAHGLARLRRAGPMRVPQLIATGEDHDDSYLLLEWVESGTKGPGFWAEFGRNLAQLHRHTQEDFGLERDNYIGSLVQRNKQEPDWPSFLIHQRLEPQLKTACDHNRVEAGTAFRFERLYRQLGNLFPPEPPALLHGDLWSGNFLCDRESRPVLIDPAVYYGHREMDLAMTRLFGGFDAELYRTYRAEWPLEKGWEERVDLCNLYPLMVHVNLFGGSYADQVGRILARFV